MNNDSPIPDAADPDPSPDTAPAALLPRAGAAEEGLAGRALPASNGDLSPRESALAPDHLTHLSSEASSMRPLGPSGEPPPTAVPTTSHPMAKPAFPKLAAILPVGAVPSGERNDGRPADWVWPASVPRLESHSDRIAALPSSPALAQPLRTEVEPPVLPDAPAKQDEAILEAAPIDWNRSLLDVAEVSESAITGEAAAPSPESSTTPPDGPIDPSDSLVQLRGHSDDADRRRAGAQRDDLLKVSRFGLLSVLLGIAACVACRQPLLGWAHPLSPVPFSIGAIALGALALVIKVIFGRTSAGVSVMGVTLGLAALGVAGWEGGVRNGPTAQHWARQQIALGRAVIARRSLGANPTEGARTGTGGAPPAAAARAPAVAQGMPAAPSGDRGSPSRPGGPPATPADANAAVAKFLRSLTPPHPIPTEPTTRRSIFDMGPVEPPSVSTAVSPPTTTASAPAVSPLVPQAAMRATELPRRAGSVALYNPRLTAAIAAHDLAVARLKAAEEDAAFAFSQIKSPEYVAAASEVDAAEAAVLEAKRRSDALGAPLLAAAAQRVRAKERLAQIMRKATENDANVAEARRAVQKSESDLRAAYAETESHRH